MKLKKEVTKKFLLPRVKKKQSISRSDWVQSQLDQIDKNLSGILPRWISKKSDYWRYSDISIARRLLEGWMIGVGEDISDVLAHLPTDENLSTLEAGGAITSLTQGLDGYVLLFQNGVLNLQHSILPNEGEGFQALSLPTLLDDEAKYQLFLSSFENFFSKQLLDSEDIPIQQLFYRLVLTCQSTFTYIDVAEQAVFDKPFYAIFCDTKHLGGLVLPTHLHLNLGKNSQVKLVELHKKENVSAHFHSFSIKLHDGALLKHFCQLNDAPSVCHHHRMDVSQLEKSKLYACGFVGNNDSAVIQRQSVINGEDADCQMYGLYRLANNQNIDHILSVKHLVGKTNSLQHFKGILRGKSIASFTSNVYVAKDAQRVDSSQLNQSLLLEKGARVNTRPQLEIYADDVKCGHGATVGPIDDEQVFYLQSRGISKEAASEMLADAFVRDFQSQFYKEFDIKGDFIDV